MKKIIIVLVVGIILGSCSTQYRCYPSKKSRDYAIETNGSKGVCAKLIKTVPLIKGGYKYFFVSENLDTLIEQSPVYKDYEKGKWYIVGKG